MAYPSVHHMISQGYDVEVWNMTGCLRGGYRTEAVADIRYEGYTKTINNLWAFRRALQDVKQGGIFFNEAAGNPLKVHVVNTLLNRYKFKFVTFLLGALPGVSKRPKRNRSWLIQHVKTPLHTLEKVLLKIIKRVQPVYADIAIFGGERAVELYASQVQKATLVEAHAWDYDKYILTHCNGKKEQFLVVDSNHFAQRDEFTDAKLLGVDYSALAKPFYEKLHKVLCEIEQHFNVEVVVAVHPRASEKRTQDNYRGRKVFKGNTVELVKESKFVLLSASTASNFVVLDGTPAAFMASDEFLDHVTYPGMQSMSAEMEIPIIKLESVSMSEIESIRGEKRNNKGYIQQYISSGNMPDQTSYQILEGFLLDEDLIRR